MERASGQLEGQCCAGGRACALTVVYSKHLTVVQDIVREGAASENLRLAGPFDLTKQIHIYCPSRQSEEDNATTSWYVLNHGGMYYFNRNAQDLVDAQGRVMNPWGAGC